jgi:hypothetical protein
MQEREDYKLHIFLVKFSLITEQEIHGREL